MGSACFVHIIWPLIDTLPRSCPMDLVSSHPCRTGNRTPLSRLTGPQWRGFKYVEVTSQRTWHRLSTQTLWPKWRSSSSITSECCRRSGCPHRRVKPFTAALSVTPFTQAVQGRTVAPLFCLAVLDKRYGHRIRGHCSSAIKPAAEIETEQN